MGQQVFEAEALPQAGRAGDMNFGRGLREFPDALTAPATRCEKRLAVADNQDRQDPSFAGRDHCGNGGSLRADPARKRGILHIAARKNLTIATRHSGADAKMRIGGVGMTLGLACRGKQLIEKIH